MVDVTIQQAHLISIIQKNPYINLNDLADEYGSTKQVVAKMCHRLENEGIIRSGNDFGTYGIHNSNGGANCSEVGFVMTQEYDYENKIFREWVIKTQPTDINRGNAD